jgi:hypothetical protein
MANPTSNFNWQMPTPTDLVTDLPADFEVFGQAVDTSLADLKGGTTDQVLAKNSNTDMDFKWVTSDDANAIQNAIVDAKGDLIGATAADTPARLAVGANGTMLIADSAAATGLAWKTAATQFPWTTYTPSLGNWTLGNGTVVGRYAQIGKTTFAFFKFTFGSTSAFPGGAPFFSLPVTAAQTLGHSGICNLQDAGTIDMPGSMYVGTSNVFPGALVTSATYATRQDLGAAVPFTWTTNDTVTIQMIYEAA